MRKMRFTPLRLHPTNTKPSLFICTIFIESFKGFENAQNTPLGFISVSDKIMTKFTSQTAQRFEVDFLAIKKKLEK